MSHLHTRPRKKSLLAIGLILLLGLILYTIFIPPAGILTLIIFFLIFLAGIFYLAAFGFNNLRKALLTSGGITLMMIFRALELRHWIYPVLILAIIISLELYFRKR